MTAGATFGRRDLQLYTAVHDEYGRKGTFLIKLVLPNDNLTFKTTVKEFF